MEKSFLVIGLGRFGMSTARMLTALGHEVMAVDKRMDRVNALKHEVLNAAQADTTDETVIEQLGVSNFDCVVICIGDDIRASILATVLCREAGAKKIIAKAQDELHEKLLLKTGADRTVQPERDGGVRLARSLSAEGIIDSLELSEEYSVSEIEVPGEWIGKSLAQLGVRSRLGISVIAMRRDGQLAVNIDPFNEFQSGDTVYVLGSNKSVEALTD